MDVTEELAAAQGLLASGDIPGLLLHLRADGEALPLGEVARLVAAAARLAGFDDLAQAAAAVADGGDGAGTQDALALYGFGYACLDRGASYLAVRPLARALELAPDAAPVLSELVTALEHGGQHARADTVRAVTPLDYRDLRGWHYVLTGGILARLSPYGFDAGMTGRWAYLSDSAEGCAAALARLRLILNAVGTAPQAVALMPDRSSRILGTAAAATLSLPTADFDPGQPAPHSLVVAYDLTRTDPGAVAALRGRAPGQVLFERATCWTDPPRVTADVSGLLGQLVIPPWARQLRRLDDGTAGHGPADDRPVETIAAEIADVAPEQDEGDGSTPPDPDENLRRFTEAVTAVRTRDRDRSWLGGIREYIPNAGPVPSSCFL